MKILSTMIKGYQRFDLNPEMSHFEYQTPNKVQIVIGTNASGKSSLVALYTLWPADHAELHRDGFIHITVEKKGVVYKLSVIKTDNGAKYKFIRDGEELNELGRITAQKELVTKHFGITQQIHALMIGEESFVEMSPMDRRKWIVKLSEMDYDYIMAIYNSIKKKMSYYKDVLKHNNKNIITDSAYIDSIDIDKMNRDHKSITEELSSLIDKKTIVPMTLYQAESKIRTLKREELMNESKDNALMAKLDRGCDLLNFDIGELESLQSKYDTEVKTKTVLIEDLTDKVTKVTESTPSMDVEEIARLKKELTELDNVVHPELLDKYKVDEPNDYLTKLFMLSKRVDELVRPMDFDVDYSIAIQNTLIGNLKHLTADCSNTKVKYEKANEEYVRLKLNLENEKVECPECSTEFRVDFDPTTYATVTKEMTNLHGILLKKENTVQDKEEELSIHIEQNNLRTSLQELLNDNNWTTSFDDSEMADYRLLPTHIRRHGTNIRLWANIEVHMVTRGEIERDLALYNSVDVNNIKVKKAHIKTLNDEIIKHVTEKNESTKTLTKLDQLVTLKEQRKKLEVDIMDTETEIKSLTSSLVVITEQAKINTQITDAKQRLAKIDSDLSDMKVKVGIVDKLKVVSKEYEELLEGSKELFRHLSPTDGFIAYSLIGFIDTFIGNINKRISDVWEYPMRISPPLNATESLNFKFKLHIDNTAPKSDIAKGSSAIKQIINLAFTLSVLDLVGLSDHPIILDEIGAPMDSQHSINVYRYIKDGLINTRDNQVFIISHDRSMYSIFDDTMTDHMAVDERNIDVSTQSPNLNNNLTRL